MLVSCRALNSSVPHSSSPPAEAPSGAIPTGRMAARAIPPPCYPNITCRRPSRRGLSVNVRFRPIADIGNRAQRVLVNSQSFKLAVIALVGLPVIACSPAKQGKADTATVQPQPNQVSFFERPATLAAVRASGDAVPALVLLGRDPSAAVIGSDTPIFALYDGGTAIWRRGDGFRTTRLEASELAQLYADLNLDALGPLYGHYEAAPMTDQPETIILDCRRDKSTIVSVYGSLRSPEVREGFRRKSPMFRTNSNASIIPARTGFPTISRSWSGRTSMRRKPLSCGPKTSPT
jgi:hypothetical protein